MVLQLPTLPKFLDLLADSENHRNQETSQVRSLVESLIHRYLDTLGKVFVDQEKGNFSVKKSKTILQKQGTLLNDRGEQIIDMSIQMDDLANLDMLEDEYKEEEKKDDWQ